MQGPGWPDPCTDLLFIRKGLVNVFSFPMIQMKKRSVNFVSGKMRLWKKKKRPGMKRIARCYRKIGWLIGWSGRGFGLCSR